MSSLAQPFDAGLQAERTLLAWRRTALAVAVVSAAGVRLTAPVIGWPAVALGVLGVALAATAYVATGARYRQVHTHLIRHATHPGDGWAPASLAAAVLMLGLVALGYLLLDHR